MHAHAGRPDIGVLHCRMEVGGLALFGLGAGMTGQEEDAADLLDLVRGTVSVIIKVLGLVAPTGSRIWLGCVLMNTMRAFSQARNVPSRQHGLGSFLAWSAVQPVLWKGWRSCSFPR